MQEETLSFAIPKDARQAYDRMSDFSPTISQLIWIGDARVDPIF